MEILFISHKYPPSTGGMQQQSFYLIQEAEKVAEVHRIIYEGKESKLMFYLKLKWRIRNILKQHPEIQLIHFNDGSVAVMCAKWIKKLTTVPVYVTLHGLDVVFPLPYFQKTLLPRLKNFDGIIAVSEGTANEILNRGFDPLKVRVVPNGVSHDIANIPADFTVLEKMSKKIGVKLSDKKIIISSGRSVERKGFYWFAKEILTQLPKDVIYLNVGPFNTSPDWKERLLKSLPTRWRKTISLLFGYPMDQYRLRELKNEEELQGRYFHLGKLPFKEMIQLIKAADLYVMPNVKVEGDYEGFGLVCLEATLAGTSVVASGREGIRCAIKHGRNGISLPSEDVETWVNKIQLLLLHPEHLELKSQKFKSYTIQNYSWEKMAQQYLDIFDQEINSKQSKIVKIQTGTFQEALTM